MRKIPFRRLLLLLGMSLMIPCYLFTVGNVLFSPWPLYYRDHVKLGIMTVACTVLLLFLFALADRHKPFLQKHEKKILLIAALFYFAVQMIMGHMLRFTPKTDAEQCFSAAQLLVDTGTFGNVERYWNYFSRCTNNLGFVYAEALIFRFFGFFGWNDRFMQLVLICSLLFTLGLLSASRIVRRIGGASAQAKLLILFASCLPFLYCTSEIYTDAFSLAFPTMIIDCAMGVAQAKDKKHLSLNLIGFALCSFAGAQMRFTAVIASVACLIVLFFSRAMFKRAAAALCAFAIALGAGSALVNHESAKHIDPEDMARRAHPILHYIAMGLPIHEDEGYGQYGDGGWYMFTTSFDDPQARDAALLTEVIDRVYYLRYPSRLLNMMSRKNLSTFGDGTFKLNEIIEADDYAADNIVKQFIFGSGKYYFDYYHVCTAFFLAQMLIAVLACIQALLKKDTRGAALFIALLGAFLFLCIWETRARYFFQFQMLLLCAGALAHTPLRKHAAKKSTSSKKAAV